MHSPARARRLRPGGRSDGFTSDGFTLVEVLLALAIVGGLLTTLIVTFNHHLGVAGRLEGELRLRDAAERFLEETLAADELADGEQSGTLDPEGYGYTVEVREPEGVVAGLGLRWVHLEVDDGAGDRVALDLWVPR